MSPHTRNQIQALTDRIVDIAHPKKIILFGSHAWGTPDADSDVDFFVIQETAAPRKKREYQLRLSLFPAGIPIDVIVYTPEEIEKRLQIGDQFIKNILQNGKVLYESRN